MEPALVQSCPHCQWNIRVLREDSRTVVCAHCRHVLNVTRGSLTAPSELPLPPLRPHRFKLGDPIHIGTDEFVVVALKELVDQKGNEYTEYALSWSGATQYLKDAADSWRWTRYIPLAESQAPQIAGDTLTLDATGYRKGERLLLELISACGEFVHSPLLREKSECTVYEGLDGSIAQQSDRVSSTGLRRLQFFRVVNHAVSEVVCTGTRGPIERVPPMRATTTSQPPEENGHGAWTVLGVILLGVGFALGSCDDDDESSCEQQAASGGWSEQRLQECRNAQSGRGGGGGHFGGK